MKTCGVFQRLEIVRSFDEVVEDKDGVLLHVRSVFTDPSGEGTDRSTMDRYLDKAAAGGDGGEDKDSCFTDFW